MNNYNYKSSLKWGFVAGSFDVIHPGVIRMFKECKKNCTNLIVALHSSPEKILKPILSLEERLEILESIKYIDMISLYKTEEELLNLLVIFKYQIEPRNKGIVRFLGDDYKNKDYTGKNLDIPIYWINRDHGWSTTKYKTAIYNQIHHEYFVTGK